MSRQVNWQVNVTPQGGTATPWIEVTNVQLDRRGNALRGRGDAAFFNTSLKVVTSEPMVTITSEDENNQLIVVVGGSCSLTLIHIDAESNATGVGSDSISYVLANAKCSNHQVSGAHAQFGQLVSQFESFSSDGVTSPLTVSVL